MVKLPANVIVELPALKVPALSVTSPCTVIEEVPALKVP